PGREYHALARVPGARQPHRVVVQVPDAFDTGRRCVVVAPASGSRGVYGAIAVGGAWGLPKGCAVAYTDKGAGTDWFDLDAGQGIAL
ncbi:3-hydroxybutyrate oligomer hydrolase family protein, partial [Acinetobacter baumannii]